ncbi:MAG: hypothetical protein QNJ55_15715 [Xenococcus sp. MO_188.B8]|nr:hypothetical protein [Xenococcus sp. MO_188.B8]
MALETVAEYYSGQGSVNYSERDSLGKPVGGLIDLGNCSKLETKITVERVEHNESQTGRGAVDATFEKAQKVEINATFDEFKRENLDLYVYGQSQELVGATVTGEEIIGHLGKKAALARMPASFSSLTNVGGATTYDETDYSVDLNTGLISFAPDASFTDGDTLEANYQAAAERITTAFTKLNTYRWLRFDGLNRGSDNVPVVIEIYKARFDPAEMMDLINEEFAEYNLNGTALYDRCYADNSLYGGFMRIRVKR